jgi:hypothetical protein
VNAYQLAKALRQRQHDQGHHPWSLLRRISDRDIIADYCSCHICGERLLTEVEALSVSEPEEFIAAMNARIEDHQPQHNQ